MRKEKDKIEHAVLRRLDCLILLGLEQGQAASWSMTEKVERLAAFGFSDTEIAGFLGKALNYVTATRSQVKRRRAKGKEHDG